MDIYMEQCSGCPESIAWYHAMQNAPFNKYDRSIQKAKEAALQQLIADIIETAEEGVRVHISEEYWVEKREGGGVELCSWHAEPLQADAWMIRACLPGKYKKF